MSVERKLPVTRSRSREMASYTCPDDEKTSENASLNQQNLSLVESHFSPRNEELSHQSKEGLNVSDASPRNPIQLVSPSSVPAISNAVVGSKGDSAALHAFDQVSNAETAQQRSQRLEAELLVLKESIGVLSANQNTIQSAQNETNRLIMTLINAQRAENSSNAQSSTAAPNSQNLQQNIQNWNTNPLVNVRPPDPMFRASNSRGKARPPNDFNGAPEENVEMWKCKYI